MPNTSGRTCSLPDCERRYNAQGLCYYHYAKARKAGEIHPLTDAERFWRNVVKTDTCWLWTGRLGNGYPLFGLDGMRVRAHRYSWEMANGPMPPTLFACHTCDTPTCVNPDHIFAGTHQDNMLDMVAKGRGAGQFARSEACSEGHLWTPESAYVSPNGARRCRICRAAWTRAYRRRSAA